MARYPEDERTRSDRRTAGRESDFPKPAQGLFSLLSDSPCRDASIGKKIEFPKGAAVEVAGGGDVGATQSKDGKLFAGPKFRPIAG